MTRFKLTIEYDGGGFVGWQRQENGPSIQQALDDAVSRITGETAEVPALSVEALDPTGAGDVFVAGFVTGTLAGWPLADRLAFASLTAALSVQEFGGSLSAPGWIEIAAWWQHAKAYDDQDRTALRRYAFLDDLLPTAARPWPLRRAVPTIGFRRT